MKKFYFLFATVFALSAGMKAQTTLVDWPLDGNKNPSSTSLKPGTIQTIGGVDDGTYVSGNQQTGQALQTTGYPEKSTGSRTAGIMVTTNAYGYKNLSYSYAIKADTGASLYYQTEYSVDGGQTWTILGAPYYIVQAGVWQNVSGLFGDAANNAANLMMRVVSIFNPGTTNGSTSQYVGVGGNYNPAANVTFDNIRLAYGTLPVKDVNASEVALVKNTVVDQAITFGTKSNVKIYNMNGQLVKSAAVSNGTSVNVSGLAKGVYVVTGDVEGSPVSVKVIKR